MKVKKRTGADHERYPYEVTIKNGRKVWIPQQKKFGSYTSSHGCSVTAVSIALQCRGRKQKSDGSILNPKEVYKWCKKHLDGYNGSKLSIYGCHKAVQGMCGEKSSTWYSNDGKRNKEIRQIITDALNNGYCVLFEEKNPIHTVALLGFDSKGRVVAATNGRIDRRSLKTEINYALHGSRGAKNQKIWWNGRSHGAGFVVVKC